MSDTFQDNPVGAVDRTSQGFETSTTYIPPDNEVDVVEEVKKKKVIEEIVAMNFDKDIIDAGVPYEKYMDAIYEKLDNHKTDPATSLDIVMRRSAGDNPHFYNSLLWNVNESDAQKRMEGDGNISAATRDEILGGEALGKFSLLQVISVYKYSEAEREEITQAYNNKVKELSSELNPLDNVIDASKTKEGKAYSSLMLSDYILKNANKESDVLKSLPENTPPRDAQKKLLYMLDSEKELFKGEAAILKDTFKQQISSQLKASQPVPDMSNMNDKDREKAARNIMLASLLFKVKPNQLNMMGIDPQKINFDNIPDNLQSVYAIRNQCLKSQSFRDNLLGNAKDGATSDDLKKALTRAQLVTLSEQTSDRDKDKFTYALTSVANAGFEGFAYPPLYIAKNVLMNPAPDAVMTNVLSGLSSMPFDALTIALDSLTDAINKSGSSAHKRAMADGTFGRMKKAPISKDLADKTLNTFYDTAIIDVSKNEVLRLNDGTKTEILAVDDNNLLVNKMACRPLGGAPISAAMAAKVLQSKNDEKPRALYIKSQETGNTYLVVGDKDTRPEDIDNTIKSFEKDGKPFDPLAPLQQRHQEKLYEKDIKEIDGKVTEESRQDVATFIAGLDKEKQKEQENNKGSGEKTQEQSKPRDKNEKHSTAFKEVESKLDKYLGAAKAAYAEFKSKINEGSTSKTNQPTTNQAPTKAPIVSKGRGE